MDGFRQSTNVGESLRSTGHLITWRPPIRLWKDVLVYKPLVVTIFLEGLRHKLVFLSITHSCVLLSMCSPQIMKWTYRRPW